MITITRDRGRPLEIMKKVEEETVVMLHVISEPGDATQYDYLVRRVGDDFYFMGRYSTMRFPRVLSYWEDKDLLKNEEALQERALEEGCNAWTLLECLRTMVEVHNGEAP